MSFDFSKYKNKSANNLEKLQKDLEKTEKKNFSDDTYWTLNKKGDTAFAIIRFLPGKPKLVEGEFELASPFIRYWDHFFKGPGGYYVNMSLTTIGKDDPVSEDNSRLWATEIESNKKIARDRKRREHYVSNILVIKDDANKDNEGKIFKFAYGKKIFEKIKSKAFPEFDGDTAVDVFDPIVGANFRLKMKKVSDYPNYDDSSFDSPVAVYGGDEEKINKMFESLYDIEDIISEDKFKPYETLKNEFYKAIGGVPKNTKSAEEDIDNLTKRTVQETNDDVPFDLEEDNTSSKSTKSDSDDLDLSDIDLNDDISFDED